MLLNPLQPRFVSRIHRSEGYTVDAYDDSANTWSTGLATMPQAVVAAGSAVAGGRLYCFGGSNSGLPTVGNIYSGTQIYTPPAGPPSVSTAISASGFGAFPTIAPGTWVEIYGTDLAGDTRSWTGADFTGNEAPTMLDGTTVTIGGQSAFIDYISATQVNALVSSNTPTGTQQMIVTSPSGTASQYTVTVNAAEPGLLSPSSFNIGGVQYAVALFTDGTYVLPTGAIAGVSSRPAKAGAALTLYGVGFGPVTPASPAGQIVQQLNSLTLPLQMSVGVVPVTPSYYGLAPGYVGLYQFNLTMPSVASGNAALTFTLNGVAGTQTLYLAAGQ
jgi:uncharacterized protein (TIGR03437 family)